MCEHGEIARFEGMAFTTVLYYCRLVGHVASGIWKHDPATTVYHSKLLHRCGGQGKGCAT